MLDFDACKSVVKAGNSGQYLLKPVITMIPADADGDRGLRADGTDGRDGQCAEERRGAQGDPAEMPNGQFVLAPLDPMKGPYDVVFTGET